MHEVHLPVSVPKPSWTWPRPSVDTVRGSCPRGRQRRAVETRPTWPGRGFHPSPQSVGSPIAPPWFPRLATWGASSSPSSPGAVQREQRDAACPEDGASERKGPWQMCRPVPRPQSRNTRRLCQGRANGNRGSGQQRREARGCLLRRMNLTQEARCGTLSHGRRPGQPGPQSQPGPPVRVKPTTTLL